MFGNKTFTEQCEMRSFYTQGYLDALKDNNIPLTDEIMRKFGLTYSDERYSLQQCIIKPNGEVSKC